MRRGMVVLAAVAVLAAAGSGGGAASPAAKVVALRVQSTIKIGGLGGGIVSAAGSIWVATSFPKAALVRIDPSTNTVTATVALGGDPDAGEVMWLAAGHGSLWVSRAYADEVDRVTIHPLKVAARIHVQEPFDVAYGFGSVWVPQFDPYSWSRIDVATNKVVKTAPATGPTSAVVSDGSVWILAHRAQMLLRLDPSTSTVAGQIPVMTGGAVPERITAGFGSIWATDPQSSSVARVAEKTGKQLVEIILPQEPLVNPYPIASGGGFIWVGSDHGVGRIDPTSNSVTGQLVLEYDDRTCGPSGPDVCVHGLTYAHGSVWVVDWMKHGVVRVAAR